MIYSGDEFYGDEITSGSPTNTDDDCDHACGECGHGIPSYQENGSLCWICEQEMRTEADL